MNEMQSRSIRPDVGSGYSDSCWLGEMMPAREDGKTGGRALIGVALTAGKQELD